MRFLCRSSETPRPGAEFQASDVDISVLNQAKNKKQTSERVDKVVMKSKSVTEKVGSGTGSKQSYSKE